MSDGNQNKTIDDAELFRLYPTFKDAITQFWVDTAFRLYADNQKMYQICADFMRQENDSLRRAMDREDYPTYEQMRERGSFRLSQDA